MSNIPASHQELARSHGKRKTSIVQAAAVENAVTLIGGTSIPKSIPVEVTLITKDNA